MKIDARQLEPLPRGQSSTSVVKVPRRAKRHLPRLSADWKNHVIVVQDYRLRRTCTDRASITKAVEQKSDQRFNAESSTSGITQKEIAPAATTTASAHCEAKLTPQVKESKTTIDQPTSMAAEATSLTTLAMQPVNTAIATTTTTTTTTPADPASSTMRRVRKRPAKLLGDLFTMNDVILAGDYKLTENALFQQFCEQLRSDMNNNDNPAMIMTDREESDLRARMMVHRIRAQDPPGRFWALAGDSYVEVKDDNQVLEYLRQIVKKQRKKDVAIKTKPKTTAVKSNKAATTAMKPSIVTSNPKKSSSGTISTAGNNDVYLGRGNGIAHNPGNIQFRDFCWQVRHEYESAHRTDKKAIAMKVLARVKNLTPPGRFLQAVYRKGGHPEYIEADDDRVVEKICQALRERKWLRGMRSSPSPTNIVVSSKNTTMSKKAKPAIPVSPPTVVSSPLSSHGSPTSTHSFKVPSHNLMLQPREVPVLSVQSEVTSPATTISATGKSHALSSFAKPDLQDTKPSPPPPAAPRVISSSGTTKKPPSTRTPIILEVGTRISVLWPLDDAYYDATVKQCSVNHHFLEYDDDGETEWLDLSRHKFKIREKMH